MPPKSPIERKSTGVTLEIPVLDYLDKLSEEEQRDRSFIINSIVKEHAKRNGTILTKKTPTPRPKK